VAPPQSAVDTTIGSLSKWVMGMTLPLSSGSNQAGSASQNAKSSTTSSNPTSTTPGIQPQRSWRPSRRCHQHKASRLQPSSWDHPQPFFRPWTMRSTNWGPTIKRAVVMSGTNVFLFSNIRARAWMPNYASSRPQLSPNRLALRRANQRGSRMAPVLVLGCTTHQCIPPTDDEIETLE
jgi:hypothetical protein